MNQVAENWKDYECMDTGNGEKLERWKDIILRRPDLRLFGRLLKKMRFETASCPLSSQ